MKFLITIIFLSALGLSALGASDPYLVESKVQTDLDSALSRLLPHEQYLVQVNSEITIKTERRVVEGETVVTNSEPEPLHVRPMPGFVPESESAPTPKPLQSRQVFRNVDTPVLTMLKVRLNLDDSLNVVIANRAKSLVQDYLRSNFPNQSTVSHHSLPMIKPPKPEPPKIAEELPKKKTVNESDEPKPVPLSPPVLSPEDQLWNHSRWVVLALLFVIILLQMRKSGGAPFILSTAGPQGGALSPGENSPWSKSLGLRSEKNLMSSSRKKGNPALLRKRLLDKFISRSEAFRFFYATLSTEQKGELYAVMKGPGFEKLLEGLSIYRPTGYDTEPHDTEEKLLLHEKRFDEYSHAKDWQDRQFFGFVQTLSDEKIMTLVNHESALSICLMLRFMKPQQSAFVLDSIASNKRQEILSHVNRVKTMPFSDLLAIEHDVRTDAMKMPAHLYGTKKEDIDFWGNVLSESLDQDTLLADIEKTNPEIYPNIARFKFRLEDAATLPDNLLNKVLGDVDNEELALALASVKPEITEVFLDALPEQRSEILHSQIVTYRRAPKDQLTSARLKLTRKIREVMS